MINWWNSLELTQQIFACIAIPSTLILLIQTILLLIGLGGGSDGDADTDLDGDGIPDGEGDGDGDGGDDGLALFSVRGIMSMLAVMGWSAMALLETPLPGFVSILISVALGVAMLFLMACVMKLIYKLQNSGNIDLGNAVGKMAQVYIPIPPKGTGSGKVHVTIQEQYCEFGAITTAGTKIKTGSYVRVVAVDEAGMLVVEPLCGDADENGENK